MSAENQEQEIRKQKIGSKKSEAGSRETEIMLERDFYLRDARIVAEELLGKCLVHRTGEGIAAGMIVETEAYVGPEDKGAHSYGGRTSTASGLPAAPATTLKQWYMP